MLPFNQSISSLLAFLTFSLGPAIFPQAESFPGQLKPAIRLSPSFSLQRPSKPISKHGKSVSSRLSSSSKSKSKSVALTAPGHAPTMPKYFA